MNMYDVLFSTYNLSCAQVLVTEGDVDDVEVIQQVRDTTSELLHLGTIPIINENDAVTGRTRPVTNTDNEIAWDNDVLAWRVAAELRADVLVLLTDIDSLYLRAGAAGSPPRRLPVFPPGGRTDALVLDGLPSLSVMGEMGDGARGAFAFRTRMAREGLEGIVTAASSAVEHGVRAAVVTSGHHPRALLRVMAGEDLGTIFVAPLAARL